jgi:hypothetical protein
VLPADDAPNVLGPSGTNHIPIPSSWRGLRPDVFMWPALPRVSVFAVDFHAGSFFYLCGQWVRKLPYHFSVRYYTDYHFNYPLDYLKGVLPVTVDTHTLEQRGVLPWAGETSVDKFHQAFAADEALTTADVLFCHDWALLCRLYVRFDKPIISFASLLVFVSPGGNTSSHDFVEDMRLFRQQYASMCRRRNAVCVGASGAAQAQMQYFTGLSSEIQISDIIPVHITHSYRPDPRKLGWVYVTADRRGWMWKNIWSVELYPVQAECFARGTPCNMLQNMELPHYSNWDPHDETLKELTTFPAVLYLPYCYNTLKFLDLYAMGMPVLVPSVQFLLELDEMVSHFGYSSVNDILLFFREKSRDAEIFHAVAAPADAESTIPGPPWHPAHRAWWFNKADIYELPHLFQFDSFDELTETLVSLHEPGQLSELSLRSRAMLRYRGELEQRSTELWRRGFERLLSR